LATHVKTFVLGPFQTNSYVCYSESDAVLVDASAFSTSERAAVASFLKRRGLTVRRLLLTHAHVDHIFGCAHFARMFQMQWSAHADCMPFLKHARVQAASFGTFVEDPPLPILPLKEGDVIRFGAAAWEVLLTPGHAPGSLCFYDRESAFAMVGDVLFENSIGRYDLPGGNLAVLMQSIYQKLLTLPDDTVVYAGHGPATTIARERLYNPFLQD